MPADSEALSDDMSQGCQTGILPLESRCSDAADGSPPHHGLCAAILDLDL